MSEELSATTPYTGDSRARSSLRTVEEIPSPDVEVSRLRVSPNLLGATALSEAANPEESIPLDATLPGVQGTAKEVLLTPDFTGVFVVGADITGPWHYSPKAIDRFTDEKTSAAGGKFGIGTYLGVGELSGETVDILKGSGSVKHDVALRGNLLVVDRSDVKDIDAKLKKQRGLPEAKFKTTINNADLTGLVEGMAIEGNPIDAVMVYMDSERTAAEIVVLPGHAESLEVLGSKN